jgi:hypothetical protein
VVKNCSDKGNQQPDNDGFTQDDFLLVVIFPDKGSKIIHL